MTSNEIWFEAICQKSGCAKYAGIFLNTFVLVTSAFSGSTLAVRISDFDVDSVIAHVKSHDKLFQKDSA